MRVGWACMCDCHGAVWPVGQLRTEARPATNQDLLMQHGSQRWSPPPRISRGLHQSMGLEPSLSTSFQHLAAMETTNNCPGNTTEGETSSSGLISLKVFPWKISMEK